MYSTGKQKESQQYHNEVLKLARESGNLFIQSEALKSLREGFEKQGRYKEALAMFDKHISLRDSIFSQEQSRDIALRDAKYDSDKKEAAMKAEQEKEREVAAEKSKQQKIIIGSVIGGLLLVVVFAGFIFRSLRITRKQKQTIEVQKTEVEQQKKLVEEHQKEIIDSITYAKRLQEAILPPLDFVKEHLPDSFILYKPKDIVAGDFYWMEVQPPPQPPEGGSKAPLYPPEGGSKESFGYETADPMLYKLLKEFVKEHRNIPTEAENIFWQLVREKSMGYKFRRQHIIGHYIADFVCLPQKLVIEVDGLIHELPENKTSDEERTRYLNEKGFCVIRFTNNEIIGNPDGVIEKVMDQLKLQSSRIPPSGGGGACIFIAAADCTGHGVPGAMVSVVCCNALNRAVKEFGLRNTGKILDKVTELVLETFEKSGEDVKDGMDVSLLAINFFKVSNFGKVEIQWSGANNALWYIQNNEVIEITANKQPIGKHDNRKPFTTHTINLQGFGNLEGLSRKPITFYLFTDGYADQFGGAKGKKFKYKQLEEVLLANSHLPMPEQKKILERTFEEWKGNLEQVDDVCVIGIRV